MTEGGKHTPAPWTFEKCRCGHPSCKQFTLNNQGSIGFSEDDARLIAAAPALLEALSFLANEVDGMRAFEDGVRQVIGHTNWSVLAVRLKEARAALLQATGGENGR